MVAGCSRIYSQTESIQWTDLLPAPPLPFCCPPPTIIEFSSNQTTSFAINPTTSSVGEGHNGAVMNADLIVIVFKWFQVLKHAEKISFLSTV